MLGYQGEEEEELPRRDCFVEDSSQRRNLGLTPGRQEACRAPNHLN